MVTTPNSFFVVVVVVVVVFVVVFVVDKSVCRWGSALQK